VHKQRINEAIIRLIIEPDGPILIKAGGGGVEPTRPDMEFVRTYYGGRETLYLPGSSLKGVLRSHCERIARTVDNKDRREKRNQLLSCDPLGNGAQEEDRDFSCNSYLTKEETKRKIRKVAEDKQTSWGAEVHKQSCFVCQMYGNTALSSHIQITDAAPVDADLVRTERRHGVAIDRVFGSVAVGPFEFEAATQGCFKTEIYIKNFTTFQLGLLALALRDLQMQRVSIGFAKSRGLGRVKTVVDSVSICYPSGTFWEIEDGEVNGVGALPCETHGYEFRKDDSVAVESINYNTDNWGCVSVELKDSETDQPIYNLWTSCVKQWAKIVRAE
jgi:CRISPR-associated RAMP protein (TIGR02581 family)